jgi:hypothetical protein
VEFIQAELPAKPAAERDLVATHFLIASPEQPPK